jgi:muramoyltetrapeptide carboxypeptidase
LALPVTAGYTLHDMAQDSVGLLDALQIDKAHIVGASMGGMIAQIIAGTYPERVLSLTSVMSTSGRRGLPGPTKAARKAVMARPDNPRDLHSVADHMVKIMRAISSPAYQTAEGVWRDRAIASVKRNVTTAGAARQLVAIAASGDRVALLKTITAPSLVIHGTSDPLVPIACGRDTANLIPNATLREIEGMGHDVPQVLIPSVLAMIATHCSATHLPLGIEQKHADDHSVSVHNVIQRIGIAIVAPSGCANTDADFPRAFNRMAKQGCHVTTYFEHALRHQRFGDTDDARAGQLHAAARNPDVEIIMALRGGYGMTRLLPQLDFKLLAASGKRLVGHSDFTALHLAMLAQTGVVTFAGPMMCSDYTTPELSDFTMRQFWSCLAGPEHIITVEAEGNPIASASGTLWGGNLAMVTHLIGTPYFPDVDRGILFLEDINEHPFRIERMMLQLLHAGILQKQQAIVLGDFSGYRLSDYDNGYDFNAMVTYLRQQLTIPILTGLPFGHIPDRVTLAVGSRAHVDSDAYGFRLIMRDYGVL